MAIHRNGGLTSATRVLAWVSGNLMHCTKTPMHSHDEHYMEAGSRKDGSTNELEAVNPVPSRAHAYGNSHLQWLLQAAVALPSYNYGSTVS